MRGAKYRRLAGHDDDVRREREWDTIEIFRVATVVRNYLSAVLRNFDLFGI